MANIIARASTQHPFLAEWVAVLLQPAVGPLGALKNLFFFELQIGRWILGAIFFHFILHVLWLQLCLFWAGDLPFCAEATSKQHSNDTAMTAYITRTCQKQHVKEHLKNMQRYSSLPFSAFKNALSDPSAFAAWMQRVQR